MYGLFVQSNVLLVLPESTTTVNLRGSVACRVGSTSLSVVTLVSRFGQITSEIFIVGLTIELLQTYYIGIGMGDLVKNDGSAIFPC